ncbi:MAG: YigZ family protein [Spirochaetes bacterium]|nr:YigZ family protein [Spirochaetota bacterium]
MKIFKKDNLESYLEVYGSRFICNIKNIKSKEEFFQFYDEIKKKYPKATHYVPVYRILEKGNIIYYFSDDKEPKKTAGFPIFNIIEKNDIINIGVCVVRYFGGIKLGTGGLQKAYSKVFLDILNREELIDYKKILNIILEVSVSNYDKIIDHLNKDFLKVKDRIFESNNSNFILKIEIEEDKKDIILNLSKKFNLVYKITD